MLWIDPYPTRLPSVQDLFRSKKSHFNLKRSVPDWLDLVVPRAFPIEPISLGRTANYSLFLNRTIKEICRVVSGERVALGIGKPSDLAVKLISALPKATSYYDAMDDFPAFYHGMSQKSMIKSEIQVSRKVDKIYGSSTELVKKFSGLGKKPILLRNACDVKKIPPYEIRHTADILGYIGTVGSWFDWDFVIRCAILKPKVKISITGPIFKWPPAALPENVKLYPACDHLSALNKMKEFRVGLIPFKLNQLTGSVDPIKYYEYRCSGLPVISTAFGEMSIRGKESGVYLASDVSLESMIEEALTFRFSESDVTNFRESDSWYNRFHSIGLFLDF